MKQLVIGDIHGCYAELQDLLEKIGMGGEDRIVALGDIVDRGPESVEVFRFFTTQPSVHSLMGNHERKHVRSARGEVRPALSQILTRREFGEDAYAEAVAKMALLLKFLVLPEALLIHGFWEPGVPLADQKEMVIVGTLTGEGYLNERYPPPWYERYDGEKPLIVGHHNYTGTRKPLVVEKRGRPPVFCIDTGCCRGHALTGLLLPDFRIASVPSRRDYWGERKLEVRDVSTPNDELSMDQIVRMVSAMGSRPDLTPAQEERLTLLQATKEEAETLSDRLLTHILRENERILALLRAESRFEELPPKEQGSHYEARVGNKKLARLLHLARKGSLTAEVLLRTFKRPEGLKRFADSLGISHPTPEVRG